MAIFRRLSADGKAAPQALLKQQQQEQAQIQPGADAAQSGAARTPRRRPGSTKRAGCSRPVAEPHTREAVIAASPRIAHRHAPLHGSIALKGGRIDDLSLEQYRETVDPNSPAIVLFSPSGAPEAVLRRVRLGSPPPGRRGKMPGPDTLWTPGGHTAALGVDHPVTLDL